MNNNGTAMEHNTTKNGFDPSVFTFGIPFVLCLIFVLLSVAFACVRLGASRSPSVFHFLAGVAEAPAGEGSVDVAEQRGGIGRVVHTTFETYPRMLYSQVLQKEGSSVSSSSSCSICLGDYKESDVLRLLPDCGHLYHLDCVDPWLKFHSTCPICRSSSSSVQDPRSSSSIGESAVHVV